VAFLSAERWPLDRRAPKDADAWPVVPNLAVEIVSPSNSMNETMERVEDYFAAGSRRVWVLLPERGKLHDYSGPTAPRVLSRGDRIDGGDLLPGFRLALGALLEGTVGTARRLSRRSRHLPLR
jgi:Uma2 family endonuclease